MQAIGSIMTFVINSMLLSVSTTAVAFFGVYYKLQNFLMMPINGLGQAVIPIVGYNYGAKKSEWVQSMNSHIFYNGSQIKSMLRFRLQKCISSPKSDL